MPTGGPASSASEARVASTAKVPRKATGPDFGHLAFRKVDPGSWNDLEALFESPGAPSYCWCMAWRASGVDARRLGNAGRKTAMATRVRSGAPIGLLGYIDDEPAAWCSIAPRSTYRRLVSDGSPDDGVWSIVCFFVVREHRGAGIARQLIDAAVRHARKCGARVVEAYPVDQDSPSYRFMGFVPMFEAAGFHEIGLEGRRRHVMQRKLRRTR